MLQNSWWFYCRKNQDQRMSPYADKICRQMLWGYETPRCFSRPIPNLSSSHVKINKKRKIIIEKNIQRLMVTTTFQTCFRLKNFFWEDFHILFLLLKRISVLLFFYINIYITCFLLIFNCVQKFRLTFLEISVDKFFLFLFWLMFFCITQNTSRTPGHKNWRILVSNRIVC